MTVAICMHFVLGELGTAPSAITDTLPAQREPLGATAALSDDDEDDYLKAKLNALRS